MVRLKGENFLMDGDQGPRKRRFYSTRIIEAQNPRRAETLARDLIGKDARLKNSVLNEVSDPPLICLESISEISAMAYDAQNRAHSFYWDDENIKD